MYAVGEAEGPNPKKKHLLHRLVKKVLIHSRQTFEIWYGLPNTRRFEDCSIWLPVVDSFRAFCAVQLPETEAVSHVSENLQAKRFSLPFQYIPPVCDVRVR
jgi:hypothetical protein